MPIRQQGRGFTLIELLVIIATIGVLAAVLLPSLASSKSQAEQTACLSNLRQISLAGMMYLTDGETAFPWNDPSMPDYNPGAPQDWAKALTNYGRIDQVRLCPSTRLPPSPLPRAPVLGTANRASVIGDPVDPPITSSYGVNGWLCHDITAYLAADKYPQNFFGSSAGVQKPGRTPLFFDANYQITWPMENDAAALDLFTGQTAVANARLGMGCVTLLRHGGPTATGPVRYQRGRALPGAINLAFADGHGGLVKLDRLWNYSWHRNWTAGLNAAP